MGLAGKNTRSSGSSSNPKPGAARFVLCVRNKDYPASLELRKVYQLLSDEQASKRHQVRVIDESGEDYLYPVFRSDQAAAVGGKGSAQGNLRGGCGDADKSVRATRFRVGHGFGRAKSEPNLSGLSR
jgi:hypothetical protein